MFQVSRRNTQARSALFTFELIYHSVVRNVRKSHRNAVAGLLLNILQTIIFVAIFYVMFTVLGMRQSALRGDFMLYLMSGIFLFLVHTKTVSAVASAEGPTSPMMQHAPLNTFVTLCAAALG